MARFCVSRGPLCLFFFSGSSLLCERKRSRNTSFFACVAAAAAAAVVVVGIVLCLYIVFVDAVFLAVSVLFFGCFAVRRVLQ